MTPHDPTLYPRYLLKAVNAFAQRDKQRLAAMTDAELVGGLNASMNRLYAGRADAVRLPWMLPGDWRAAHDQREGAEMEGQS